MMMRKQMLNLSLKHQKINYRDGFRYWESVEETVRYPVSETAVIIVDMWDQHWSDGFTRRCGVLADKINEAVKRARERGILIVHAPSDVQDFYEGTAARDRLLSVQKLAIIPDPVTVRDYPLPIDDSDGGSDTVDTYPPNTRVWKRQSARIDIDQSCDIICGDEGDGLFSYLSAGGIKYLIYTGVAANMCVLNRSFGIKKMLRRSMKTVLVRDLTDAVYNPEKPPYVSHEEGTKLVVEYIEKFYCPTIDSSQL
jgi:nicotinamidase-related amidase